MNENDFSSWFSKLTGCSPHPWQRELAGQFACCDRLLRVPTGFGKTAGTVLPWLFHRVVRADGSWPNRLVFCLPMRVLVEQTEEAIHAWLRAANLSEIVNVVVLLGGRHESTWLEHAADPTIVIGTQDMLLSRALGRGYGSARGLWPMEMGLLQRDALWVVDEVQLMDVGLATTAQLHAFRQADRKAGKPSLRPTHTWWMSATMQPRWLETADFRAEEVQQTRLAEETRRGGLWEVDKRLARRSDLTTPEEIAKLALDAHDGATTLVIVNTVDRARKVHAALTKAKSGPVVHLVHSRFRGAERSGWGFLRRTAAVPTGGRIIVATQVVEAGVDLSASTLITDLAPWSSLVQRFGRCARYAGEVGRVLVVNAPSDEKKAAPYTLAALEAAHQALELAGEDVGPRAVERFEERLAQENAALLATLYPYAPLHVLRRADFDDLFDTTADLSGADLDVGRYIRSGEERDVSVFWRELPRADARELRDIEPPARDELCPVPVGEIRDFISAERVAFVHDYVSGTWKRAEKFRIVPGKTLLLATCAGGYDPVRGWDPKATTNVSPIACTLHATSLELASDSAADDDLSEYAWKSIATHGRETGAEARHLARSIGLDDHTARILELAGRWHDAGKAHQTFQAAIRDDARTQGDGFALRRDLAKAPRHAWRRPAYPGRPGFRHELASTLMMLEVLRRTDADHAAMTAPHAELLTAMGSTPAERHVDEVLRENALADELRSLSETDANLAMYLVCAHHGKVRTSWATTPLDQQAGTADIHGVREADRVGPLELATMQGTRALLPELELSLACAAMGLNARYGASWSERVIGLLDAYGPFSLAYLEALLRAADWRASQLLTPEDS